jgi:hypothetical protein
MMQGRRLNLIRLRTLSQALRVVSVSMTGICLAKTVLSWNYDVSRATKPSTTSFTYVAKPCLIGVGVIIIFLSFVSVVAFP